jgi:mannose-6-phosphate isomerase-like protein (cupin superfamily)
VDKPGERESGLGTSVVGTNLEAVAAFAVAREGVIWALDASEDLNSNLVHFGAGRGVGEHLNEGVDVIFVGVSGSGTVTAGGEEYALDPAKLVFVPKSARRSTRSMLEDFSYLTIHRRRGPLRPGRSLGTSASRSGVKREA